jgi:glycerol uptake facilitator-like aquaporin
MFAHLSDSAKRSAAEVIGTFCLVFAGTGAVIVNDVSGGKITHVGVALTFGLVVMSMIYAVGDVSGAHLNPAVTLGFWIAKRFPGKSVLSYILSQLAGAFLATGVLRAVFLTHDNLGATIPSGAAWQSFVLEIILTAILMFVILADLRCLDESRSLTSTGRCVRQHDCVVGLPGGTDHGCGSRRYGLQARSPTWVLPGRRTRFGGEGLTG